MDSRRRACFPGSFDPVTFGHLDLIGRAVPLFKEVVVAVGRNIGKSPLLELDDRLQLLEAEVAAWPRTRVVAFDGLVTEFCRTEGLGVLLRGMRGISDFEAEMRMAAANAALCPEVETLLLPGRERYSHVSSRLVREIAACGGSLEAFVPPAVAARLRERYGSGEESPR